MDVIKSGIFKKAMIFLLAVFLMNSEQLKSGELLQQKIDGRSLAIGFVAGGAVVALFGWYLWRVDSTVGLGHDFLKAQMKEKEDELRTAKSKNTYLKGENTRLREENKKIKDIEAENRYLTRDMSRLRTHASEKGTLALVAERDDAVRRAQETAKQLSSAQETWKETSADYFAINRRLIEERRQCSCRTFNSISYELEAARALYPISDQ